MTYLKVDQELVSLLVLELAVYKVMFSVGIESGVSVTSHGRSSRDESLSPTRKPLLSMQEDS